MFRLEKWYEVNEDSYKLIYEQAKIRFEEYASESESITNKSIKILTSIVALSAFFVGFATSHKFNCISFLIIGILIVLFCFALYHLFILIAPKNVSYRGVDPRIAGNKDVFDPENKDYQTRGMYYNLIGVISDNIDFMSIKNKGRANQYKLSLMFLYAMIICIGLYIGITIRL
jgi:hypothetical protein